MAVSSLHARAAPAGRAAVRIGRAPRTLRTTVASLRRRSDVRPWRRLTLLLPLLLCAALPFLPDAHAAKHPRQPKPMVEIVAAGKVTTNGAPAVGAVVYLENPTSLAVKSYLTGPNGEFHFNNISPQTDYEVWAELNGVQSKHKFISQFSNHTKFTFTLKLVPKGKHKLLGIL